ncbi:acyl-CoA dehydrogenase family protein [Duganella callida]|uniref:Monooxygenase n=1 Tax=Duganella callida TaxID=2561932 RepID=A0A4Y9SXC2_9BURK|nr:acyl-CoA dehydrogenase family protein [Duganella callida]TFW31284.1 monooxygenase [Duganella callida]
MSQAVLKTPQIAAYDPLAVAADLARRLGASANQRDQAGGHAAQEREWIRASGLLTLSIPTVFGGHGADWPTVCQVIRIMARADSALAHLLGFHHLQLAGIQLYGTPQQQKRFYTLTVEQNLFWGNALNPLDKRSIASDADYGYQIDGVKSFSSGSVGSDWLTISAWHEATQSALIGVVPTRQSGVTVQADWDAFGQKQTDSGNVHFNRVSLPATQVLQAPGAAPTAQATLRSQVAQLIMTNLYLGIGEGAFEAARGYLADEARPWFASGAASAGADPLVQHRLGQLWLKLRPAAVLAEQAAQTLERLYRLGAAVTAQQRGALAVTVAEAKVLAHRAGVEVSSEIFELTGARSTSAKYGFDRFWRNARVHTLHDPVDYKIRDLGRYAFDGTLPEPTAYS